MPALPSLFLSHGAPDLVLQDLPASRFLRTFGQRLPRPSAIVVASAHWTTRNLVIDTSEFPETIHDFSGFSQELASMRYPAPGKPALAQRLIETFNASGIPTTGEPRGLDHGVWAPLALMFPTAHIPVVALSIQPGRDPSHHLAVGEVLAQLRTDNVLVIGSGAITHNLGEIIPHSTTAPDWVAAFDAWVVERATSGDTQALTDWQRRAPHAHRNHPTPEHLLPFFIAMGAGGPAQLLHRSTTWGVLRMTMLGFGMDSDGVMMKDSIATA